jgi:hypothetical protein
MRVTMLEDRKVTVDGVNTIDAEDGETYEMGPGVAADLVAQGAGEYADPDEAKAAAAADENKDAGGADENKDAGGADEDKGEPTFASRVAALATHAEANELAGELAVEGFEEKKPNLDAKRAALHEAAEARDAEAAAAGDE